MAVHLKGALGLRGHDDDDDPLKSVDGLDASRYGCKYMYIAEPSR